jgi:hypothetical protein
MTCPPTTTELLDPLADLDGEELACLGLRRANDFMDVFADLNRQAHEEWVASLPQPSKPPKPRKPRAPSISKMIERAEKATGKAVTAITLPDGTKLDFGKPAPTEPENPWPLDEFRTKETKQ